MPTGPTNVKEHRKKKTLLCFSKKLTIERKAISI